MARIKKRYSHVIDYKELHDLLTEFQNRVYEDKAKKMPYAYWRDMIKATADDWALFEIEWESDGYETFIDIFYDSNRVAWSFNTGDNSFGDFIYKNLLFGVEDEMRREYPSEYIDQSGQYYEYYDSRTGKSTIYEDLAPKAKYASSDSVVNMLATKAEVYDLDRANETINKLCESAALAAPLKNENNNNKTNKENTAMKFNFDFGPVNASMVRMSLYGLAVKNKAGTWVSYDAKAGDIMDVDILNFDGAKFLYKMPVAIKDIAIGDVVIHNGIPMFVIAIATNGTYITAVDPINGERKDIMLPKSPFGFNFATKVVNFLGNTFNASATAENPFGNMWMLMAMSGENKDMNDILPFLMMNNATPGIDNNVLMFMALSNTKDGSKDMLPWLLMMNTQNSTIATPAHTCTCGGHCDENHTQG
jgi:hypothetical protein